MSITRLCIVTALTVLSVGCHSFGLCAKRESESNCPTDIRKTVPWCAGEDAIFVCPCGPEGNFYGHRPTCWRDWPTSAAAWRDMSCGPTVIAESVKTSEPNPFRGSQPATVLPTPAPEPDPITLPPLPNGEAKAIEEDAQPETLGPPVLPPSSSVIPLHSPQSAAAGHLPIIVSAPKDTKIKFVAAKSRVEADQSTLDSRLDGAEASAIAAEETGQASVQVAELENAQLTGNSAEETDESHASYTSPVQPASVLCSLSHPEMDKSEGDLPAHVVTDDESVTAEHPRFVRPNISVKLVR